MFQVLVAEDELWIRDAVVEMVESMHPQFHVVGEASNGEEAWNFINEHWPSIVITDIMMPKKTGLWLIEQIYELNLPVVVIVVSGYDNFQYAKQAMRYGITEYLLKPVDEVELQSALNRSTKRLEQMTELHEGYLTIQSFIEQLPEMSPKTLSQQINSLLTLILKQRAVSPSKVKSLLTILSMKLNELFQAMIPEFAPTPLTEEDEQGIRKHFTGLLDMWLIASPKYEAQQYKNSIKQVCDYIDSHYYENFTLARLADMSHMSVSYFSLLFKKTTGQTFLNYLNEVRLQKAKELLQEPDLKIYEIADMVGYTSLPYFNRIFKQIITITPVEYRKRLGL
ncbi:response regulator transcription factor [Paenibacillus roseipurpureus]|uniref:Response regulator n=1 Tax=Paenibacillus roseopurpureus TaxID=2918901 RepID=A0AA96RIP4_9BACL|nr:response regulator [Paenibacillus sp. MBLB1832]WNR43025.1 response regulator [Paenibacillus sp. MBLB1832]